MSSENTRGSSYQGHAKAEQDGRRNQPANSPDRNPPRDPRDGRSEQADAAEQNSDQRPTGEAGKTALSSRPDATSAFARENMPHGIGYNICDDD